jgi:hypothetical protein
MKTTLIRPDGARLVIEPSPALGSVRVYVLGSTEVVTIPASMAGVAAQAIEGAAACIEQWSMPEVPA